MQVLRVSAAAEALMHGFRKGSNLQCGGLGVAAARARGDGHQQREDELYSDIKRELAERRVRPSLLQPAWAMAGYFAGVGSKLVPGVSSVAALLVTHSCDNTLRSIATGSSDVDPKIKELVKRQRDEPGRAALAESAEEGVSLMQQRGAVLEGLKAGMRVACDITARY
jgi:ubiquinone biosynthesis monooxygenase Coq7